jgi:hypothetical protein
MSAMANFKGFVLALVMAVRKPLAWLVLMRHNGGLFMPLAIRRTNFNEPINYERRTND